MLKYRCLKIQLQYSNFTHITSISGRQPLIWKPNVPMHSFGFVYE